MPSTSNNIPEVRHHDTGAPETAWTPWESLRGGKTASSTQRGRISTLHKAMTEARSEASPTSWREARSVSQVKAREPG